MAAPVLSSTKYQSIAQPKFETYSLTNPANACYGNSLLIVLASTPEFVKTLKDLFVSGIDSEFEKKLGLIAADIENMIHTDKHTTLKILDVNEKFNYVNERRRKQNENVFSAKVSNDWVELYKTIQDIFNEVVSKSSILVKYQLPNVSDDYFSNTIQTNIEDSLSIQSFYSKKDEKISIFELTETKTLKELLKFDAKNNERYEAYAIIGYTGGHFNCVVLNSRGKWTFFDNQHTQLLEYPFTTIVGEKGTKERIKKDSTLQDYVEDKNYSHVGIFYRRVNDKTNGGAPA